MAGENQRRRFIGVRPGILFLAPLAFALAQHSGAQSANTSGDVFIVEHPQRLLLYNKFQQPSSDRERRAIPSFVPMLILKSSDMLGDGFTPCMKVQLDNDVCYLLRDTDGTLAGSASAGYSHVYYHVTLLDDTLQVLRDGRMTLKSPTGSSNRRLRKGELIVRAFRDGVLTYVWASGPPPSYGWVTLGNANEGSAWKVFASVPPNNGGIADEVLSKIEAKIRETNTVLARLFEYLNAQTGDQRSTPRWRVSQSGKSIVCTFSDQRLAPRFEQSTRLLERDIQALLSGTGFETIRSVGRIEVRPK